MFGTTSRVLFFSYIPYQQSPSSYHFVRPYDRPARRKKFLSSVLCSLVLVLSEQHRLRLLENSLSLTFAGREIFRLSSFFNSIELQSSNDMCLPILIPVSYLLEVCEGFIMSQVNRNGFPVVRAHGRDFFSLCGVDKSFCLKLSWLQSFLRNLLLSGRPSYFMPSDPFGFPHDPFCIDEDCFLSRLSSGFTNREIDTIRNGYFAAKERFFSEGETQRRGCAFSISWATNIIFSYVRILSNSVSTYEERTFCLDLSYNCIDILLDCLGIFNHPDLIFSFTWECYRFSGFLIECFSNFFQDVAGDEDVVVSVCQNNYSFHLDWIMPYMEWCFLSRINYKTTSIDLCRLFMRSYNPSGRNHNLYWSDMNLSFIPEENLPIFQVIFSYWLTSCQKTILNFIQVHDSLCLDFPYSRLYRDRCSLAQWASICLLESEQSPVEDDMRLYAMEALLNVNEVESTITTERCYLIESMIFSRYYSSRFANRYIEKKLKEMISLMDKCSFLQAKACFLSILRALPYCENSFSSFCHVQLIMKIVFSNLNQLGSRRSNIDLSSLLYFWRSVLSFSSFNFCQFSLHENFWMQLIELFRYQFSTTRQVSVEEVITSNS